MNNSSWIVQVLQCPNENCGSYTPISQMDQNGVLICDGCGATFELYEKDTSEEEGKD